MPSIPHKPWFVYILRCADNSLYTGITTDVNKRIDQHNGQTNDHTNGQNNRDNKKGAKYTRGRRPVTLVFQEQSSSRSTASKREYAIRTLKKSQKEQLIVATIKAAEVKTRQTCSLLT